MIIVDPTVTNTEQNNTRAPAVAMLKGKTIGVLSNRKLNADLLLRETALRLVTRHGGKVLPMKHKLNPSAPSPGNTLTDLSSQCDYLLTAIGD